MIELILSILFVALIIGSSLLFNDTVYNYLFEHKDWKLWKKYIKSVDEFKYVDNFISRLAPHFTNGEVTAIIWEDGLCSIHEKDGRKCILCSFDEKHSKEFADKLLEKYNNNIDGNEKIISENY